MAYYPLGDQDSFNGSNYLVPNSSLKDFVFNFIPNDYIDCGAISVIPSATQLTVSFWANTNSLSQNQVVFGDNSSSPIFSFEYWGSANSMIFEYGVGTYAILTLSSVVTAGIWHNLVLVYNASGVSNTDKIKVYVNGDDKSSLFVYTGTIPASLNASIGNFWIGNGQNYNAPFNGKLSNFQIFNTALPATGSNSVETLYNNGSPLTSMSGFTSLQAWYKLDASATYDSSTTTWTIEDSSSNSNTGTSSGMTQANLIQSDLSFTSGYSPYALDFDGANDYIDCGNDSSLEITGNFTISAWVNITSSGYYPRLLGKSNTSNNRCNYAIGFLQNKPSIEVNSNGTWIAHYNSATALSTGVWHHIVGVYNGTNFLLYANGSLDTTNSASGFDVATAASETSGQHLYIGATTSNAHNFNGSISNASIWNAALTSSQVTELYSEGVPQNLNNHSAYSNLVSWWQLGSNSSFNTNWTVLDEKGSNNGVSSNMTEASIVDGINTYGGGTSSGMGGDEVVGSAFGSSANSLSINMDVLDRTEDTPS